MLTIHVWPKRLKEFLLTHPLYKSPSLFGFDLKGPPAHCGRAFLFFSIKLIGLFTLSTVQQLVLLRTTAAEREARDAEEEKEPARRLRN